MLTMRTTVAAAIVALLPQLAAAQTDPKARLREAVGAALAPLLGDSSRTAVDKLMEVKPEGAISRGFNVDAVAKALFGRNATNVAADCRTSSTALGEADTGLCMIDSGARDHPTAAYSMLAFSKNIGMGDIVFARRSAFNPGSETLPPAVRLSDADAYNRARAVVEMMGVPKSEIPVAPADAKNKMPVRSLVIGADQRADGGGPRIAVQKVVTLPRAFVLPGGLKLPTGQVLSHVIAPGGATVAMDDGSLPQMVRIDGWFDAQMDPKLDPRLAKTTAALTNEITDDLYGEGVRQVGSLSILIALRRAYPNPDDPNPPLCPVCGVLRPALKVIVSQPGVGPVASSEKAWVAPGLVREFDLVEQTDQERPSR
ncbi:MAG: hypothetical protein H7242_19085 [Microbacteriaceae bacterium]|nr:hypothetical protein [Burkholderiaceae bacterium]